MKIGIGITTMGKRVIRNSRYMDSGLDVNRDVYHIYVDEKREGPAAAKNETMKALYDEGCTHMFLFDDDCYPVMDGWVNYVITNAQQHRLEYVGLPESFKSTPVRGSLNREFIAWDGMLGCFLFQTRAMLETVGYYNRNYQRYGFEDSARNDRMRRAMGYPIGQQPSLLRLPSFIHSEDVYDEYPLANLTSEEKTKYIDINRPEWTREVTSDQLYYPYR